MDTTYETMQWFIRTPLLKYAYIIVLTLAYITGPWIAAGLNWTKWGTRLTLASIGTILIITFGTRIGFYDLAPTAFTCANTITSTWATPESILNLVLTIPLGAGLYWATYSIKTSLLILLITVITVETGQAITGLGTCQNGDLARNAIGGTLAILGFAIGKNLTGKGQDRGY